MCCMGCSFKKKKWKEMRIIEKFNWRTHFNNIRLCHWQQLYLLFFFVSLTVHRNARIKLEPKAIYLWRLETRVARLHLFRFKIEWKKKKKIAANRKQYIETWSGKQIKRCDRFVSLLFIFSDIFEYVRHLSDKPILRIVINSNYHLFDALKIYKEEENKRQQSTKKKNIK